MKFLGALTLRIQGSCGYLPHLRELFLRQLQFGHSLPAFRGSLSPGDGSSTPRRATLAAIRSLSLPARGRKPRHNRNNPDFRFSLPILLNWYGRRIRYYPHLLLRTAAHGAAAG